MKKILLTSLFITLLVSSTYGFYLPLPDPITVAIVGSGLDLENETDIKNYIWINNDEIPNNGIDDDKNGYTDDIYGWNFITETGNIDEETDKNSHETYVVKDLLNESIWKNKENHTFNIMSIKVFTEGGSDSNNIQGIGLEKYEKVVEYAVNNGAKIISLSLNFDVDNPIEIERIIQKYPNIMFVQAAGNKSVPFYQDLRNTTHNDYNNRIIVGALDGSSGLAKYSNYGDGVDVYEDGRHFYKVSEDKFWRMTEGTSFAVPKVVARIINLMHIHPEYSIKEIKDSIKSSSRGNI